ncbi:28S ribosomal protein S15, mitochondrial [Osmia bicornis bicornis]|uniref:28S ribosomal protein S15, mitochondrial n=1 Tax=Osmia bicornis bicornis TaxID=1437191 RepID=UPI001EAF56CE|nr:28S ribosomal protein S15, mitochondrial [Osmia bicornis bicornis]
MNLTISRRLLCTKMNNIYMFGGYLSRNFATIDDYNIKWTRPERTTFTDPKFSGDLGLDVNVKPTDIKLYYEKSKELEDADDVVKRMFSLKFQRNKETRRLKSEKIMRLVKRHVCDRGSMEVSIAAMTSEIHDLQKYYLEQPSNKRAKVFLKELIEKRKKCLKFLRSLDYGRFEWVLEQLNLEYKLLPEKPNMISRKDSLRMLTEEYCNNIIQGKIDAYKVELKEKQKKFYLEKAEKLTFIMKEEKECGLTPTVTEEEIEDARQKVELLNKSEQTDSSSDINE